MSHSQAASPEALSEVWGWDNAVESVSNGAQACLGVEKNAHFMGLESGYTENGGLGGPGDTAMESYSKTLKKWWRDHHGSQEK